MIQEAYVSFGTAKLLREKGFDEPSEYFYKFNSRQIYRGMLFTNSQTGDKFYSAPTQQMAMCWLREVHNLCIEPYRTACGYLFTVSKIWTGSEIYSAKECGDDEDSGQFTTWELCVDYAIKYCLEHLIG